jgi:hypothetical protein
MIAAQVISGGPKRTDAVDSPVVGCDEVTVFVRPGLKLFAFGADVR